MFGIFLLPILIQLSAGALISSKNVTFIILSQNEDFHKQVADNLNTNIMKQYKNLGQDSPVIYLTHKDFLHAGSWTIFPLLLHLSKLDLSHLCWLIFLDEYTAINLKQMNKKIENCDKNEKIWIGNELYDNDATIIHHFAFHENPSFLKYPNIASGFAMSIALFKSVAERLKSNVRLPDFSIDNSYELALFIWDEGKGHTLTHDPSFCIRNAPQCATYVNPRTNQNKPVPNEEIVFLVKTCEKFHAERIPVIKHTWGKTAIRIKYFSNKEVTSIPTIDLGLPNTERGHCAKTIAILKYIHKDIVETKLPINWIVVVDDDTILSVSRLQHLLSYYNHTNDIAIGERYGYNIAYTPVQGYNYITGGGGMVFSMSVVTKLIKNCKCPAPDAPDDMIIGACMATLNIKITHSAAFHQARPVDYSPKYLQNQEAISFHKHWMIDPLHVYTEWFDKFDSYDNDFNVHNEL